MEDQTQMAATKSLCATDTELTVINLGVELVSLRSALTPNRELAC